MATALQMPKNGMDMEEGTIVRWLKNVGDKIEKDEPFMEIETDKITMESESPAAGVLLAKLYEDGAVVPVLTTIGYIGEPGEAVPTADAPAAAAAAPAAEEAAPKAEAAQAAPAKVLTGGNGIAATPYARKLAKDNGISLADVAPTGRHGEIRARDIEAALNAQPKASPLARAIAADLGIDLAAVQGSGYRGKVMSGDLQINSEAEAENVKAAIEEIAAVLERRKLSGMRKAILKSMTAAHTQVPDVTQNYKVDVTDLMAFRAKINEGREKADKISVNDIIIKAVGKAVAKFERFRMSLDGNEYVLNNRVNIGMAVAVPDGLVVPAIRDVDKKTLTEISKEAKMLAKKARDGKLGKDDMGDCRTTISNQGMYGLHSFNPIINLPEASIIGVCAAEDELALIDGQVVNRKKMMICVTYDHRVMNGAEVCEFQQYLKQLLENPVTILI